MPKPQTHYYSKAISAGRDKHSQIRAILSEYAKPSRKFAKPKTWFSWRTHSEAIKSILEATRYDSDYFALLESLNECFKGPEGKEAINLAGDLYSALTALSAITEYQLNISGSKPLIEFEKPAVSTGGHATFSIRSVSKDVQRVFFELFTKLCQSLLLQPLNASEIAKIESVADEQRHFKFADLLGYVAPQGHSAMHALFSFADEQVDKAERLSVLNRFIELGADINIQNHKGETPLLMLASRGMSEYVNLLYSHFDADPTLADDEGYKPSDFYDFSGESVIDSSHRLPSFLHRDSWTSYESNNESEPLSFFSVLATRSFHSSQDSALESSLETLSRSINQ